jgi:hypothetical protein
MTKKELKFKAEVFIQSLPNEDKTEWYGTTAQLSSEVIADFLKDIGIDFKPLDERK